MWSGRLRHAAVVHDGAIVILGGLSEDGRRLRDLWKSRDGATWENLPDPPFPPREGHVAATVDERIFVMGGCGEEGMLADAWCSRDGGASWVELEPPPFPARSGAAAVVANGLASS